MVNLEDLKDGEIYKLICPHEEYHWLFEYKNSSKNHSEKNGFGVIIFESRKNMNYVSNNISFSEKTFKQGIEELTQEELLYYYTVKDWAITNEVNSSKMKIPENLLNNNIYELW